MSHGLDGDEDDDEEVVELEDDSVKDGDPRDQTRPPVRDRLLLALAGIGVVKQGFSGTEGFGSGRYFSSSDGGETPATYEVENSEKDSSTKWESHSRFANSSAGSVTSVEGTDDTNKLVLGMLSFEVSSSGSWWFCSSSWEGEDKSSLSSWSPTTSSSEKLSRSSTEKSTFCTFTSNKSSKTACGLGLTLISFLKLVFKAASTHSISVSTCAEREGVVKVLEEEGEEGNEEERRRCKGVEMEEKGVVSSVKH